MRLTIIYRDQKLNWHLLLWSCWKRRKKNFCTRSYEVVILSLHSHPLLDIYIHDLVSWSKNDFSHFFLSPAVN